MKTFRVNFGVSYEVEADDGNDALQEAERILEEDLRCNYVGEILGGDVEEIEEDIQTQSLPSED